MKRKSRTGYALCIRNRGYEASLEVRKIYRILPDKEATGQGMLRVVDESEEDYLYPSRFFVTVSVPEAARSVFAKVFKHPQPRATSV